MQINIEPKAETQILSAYAWGITEFGVLVADRFLANIQHDIQLLSIYPYIGFIEERLADKSRSYRSLPVRPHFRLIYYVDESQSELHIVDFWDVRRDPKQLTNYINMQVK